MENQIYKILCYFCTKLNSLLMTDNNFSELGRIEAIAKLYKETPYEATKNNRFHSSGKAYISHFSKVFLEGVDFDLVYFPLQHLGYKCATAVVGELYAQLASPRTLSIQLGISSKLDFNHIKTLWSGIVTAAKEHGVENVALDLNPSRNGLVISISGTGETICSLSEKRPSPASKDLICISGSLGGAFLGMQVLEQGRRDFDKNNSQPKLEKYRMMIASYLKPEISPSTISHLEETGILPSTGYLVSKGLSDTIKKIVRDTGLGAKIYADKIPFEGNSFELGKEMDIDPISAAMNGGEDYRLLFTIPIMQLESFRRDFQTFDIIGHLALPEVGAVLVTPEGIEHPMKSQGWRE